MRQKHDVPARCNDLYMRGEQLRELEACHSALGGQGDGSSEGGEVM
jgi:hypothetical protein